MMQSRCCIVIPAVRSNAPIPDYLVKRLAGKTLIQRALDVALGVASPQDIVVITDSEEIGLAAQRNGVRCLHDTRLRLSSPDLMHELYPVLAGLAAACTHIAIYHPGCPLLTSADIRDACRVFLDSRADSLVTVRSVRHRIWEMHDGGLGRFSGEGESEVVVESRALVLFTSEAVRRRNVSRIIPYFFNDRAVEINSYQDWWICERLLERRHVVFVVAGYPAIGMGHVYRALMLAHEIVNHGISFVCTRQSELAARNIAARDYRTIVQGREDTLADVVLEQKPDLVINDILDTTTEYIRCLKEANLPVINFEDEGPGADLADMVFNALYEKASSPERQPPRFFYGHHYFCLRDEFLAATRNPFRPGFGHGKGCLLITFGGTDEPDFTRQTLDVALSPCLERGISIRVVTGPGYAHRDRLAAHIGSLHTPSIRFEYATNIMSRMMEGVDLAICSAGRTVYELAHMRIPAIVLAQHSREARHTFARTKNGFVYLGIMRAFRAGLLARTLDHLLDNSERRQLLYERQSHIDFHRNKEHVVRNILSLLGTSDRAEANSCCLSGN